MDYSKTGKGGERFGLQSLCLPVYPYACAKRKGSSPWEAWGGSLLIFLDFLAFIYMYIFCMCCNGRWV